MEPNQEKIILKSGETMALFCRIQLNTRKELPVRSSEMGMLIYIVKSESPVTPIMVADFFKVTKPMVTAMTKNLLKLGYVDKVDSTIDKRSFTLVPTTKAKLLIEETYEDYHKNVTKLIENMGLEAFTTMITLIETANNILLKEAHNG